MKIYFCCILRILVVTLPLENPSTNVTKKVIVNVTYNFKDSNMNKNIGVILAVVLFSGIVNAGSVKGPINIRDTVKAGEKDNFIITFKGSERAKIVLRGDGSSDIDCDVYDNKGNFIGSDINLNDHCDIEWVPRWTGKFELVIKNIGITDNKYLMKIN